MATRPCRRPTESGGTQRRHQASTSSSLLSNMHKPLRVPGAGLALGTQNETVWLWQCAPEEANKLGCREAQRASRDGTTDLRLREWSAPRRRRQVCTRGHREE